MTFCTTRVFGRQPNAPAAFTPGEIPGTYFQRLSRPQGTWFCRKEPRKKILSDTTGDRSRDSPTGSALTTTHPSPLAKYFTEHKLNWTAYSVVWLSPQCMGNKRCASSLSLMHTVAAEVLLHSFLTSALGINEWWTSSVGRFAPGIKNLLLIEQEAMWAPEAVWSFWSRTKFLPLPVFDPRTVQPVA